MKKYEITVEYTLKGSVIIEANDKLDLINILKRDKNELDIIEKDVKNVTVENIKQI